MPDVGVATEAPTPGETMTVVADPVAAADVVTTVADDDGGGVVVGGGIDVCGFVAA